jgi:hypothetical protein
MFRNRIGASIGALAFAALGAVSSSASAQDEWPSKAITYVVPFAPGGNTDTLARIITLPGAGRLRSESAVLRRRHARTALHASRIRAFSTKIASGAQARR